MYLDFDGLKEQLGYKVYKPRIGNVGRALIKASKEGNQRSVGWMKPMLDELFKKTKTSTQKRKEKI